MFQIARLLKRNLENNIGMIYRLRSANHVRSPWIWEQIGDQMVIWPLPLCEYLHETHTRECKYAYDNIRIHIWCLPLARLEMYSVRIRIFCQQITLRNHSKMTSEENSFISKWMRHLHHHISRRFPVILSYRSTQFTDESLVNRCIDRKDVVLKGIGDVLTVMVLKGAR